MLFARRERFERLGRKIGRAFARLRISPNQWTGLSLLLAAAAAYFIAHSSFLLGAVLLAAFSFVDVVDGAVARVTGRASRRGAYLDTIADRYAEVLAAGGLLFVGLPAVFVSSYVWIFLYMFGSLMTTYAKAAASEKLSRTVKGGIAERAERMVLLFLGLVLAVFDPVYLAYMLVLLAAVSNISALQRIAKAIKIS